VENKSIMSTVVPFTFIQQCRLDMLMDGIATALELDRPTGFKKVILSSKK